MEQRFNFISETGDCLGFVMRLAEEGEAVRMWARDEDAFTIGDGLVPKAEDLEDMVYHADPEKEIFIFDTSGSGVLADGLRQMGFPVLGGSMLADVLERNRRFAHDVMEDCGIACPETFPFDDFDSAIEFGKGLKPKTRMVYKPSKRLGELSPSLVTADKADCLYLLDHLKTDCKMAEVEFCLQEFIEGVEISTEGWFSHGEWLPMFNHTFERKQLMPGNLGPSGGCSGNAVWTCDSRCPICNASILRMEPWLRKQRYEGMIDINCIVNPEGVYGLEFTPRFGYDATPTLFYELAKQPIGGILRDTISGQMRESPFVENKVAAGVKISIPPWPSEEFHAKEDIAIRGFEKEDIPHLYWYNVKSDGASGIASAGAWGIIAIALGTTGTVGGAFRRAYDIADRLKLQNKQYRNDLGEEFSKAEKELEEIGLHEYMG